MIYRGIKLTSDNVWNEKVKAQPGIYRGTKHNPIKQKQSKPLSGIYRGVAWAS